MKIALISQEYPPETARGGIGTQAYAKANGLFAMGHTVYVISRSKGMERSEEIVSGVHVIRVPGLEKQLPEMTEPVQWLTHSMVVAAEIEALHKKVQLDIIDLPEWAAEGYIHLLNRTPWHSIPTVIQLHGPLVMLAHSIGWPHKNSSLYKVGIQMEATCIQLADAIYSSSECSANWIRDHYEPVVQDIPVIHLGVDTNTFTNESGIKNTRPTIVFAGRLVENKGVEELVDAALQLSKEISGLQLRLIGSSQENFIKKITQKAHKENAVDVLDLVGFVDKEHLPAELSKAHVFAAPSYYEGGPGFVYLEAMACGLPVIGCTGSGVEEIIEDGVNGYLVPPKDVKSLTHALRKILCDKIKMQQMGSRARAFAVREADTQHCLQKLEAYYYSVLEKNKAIAE